jgi:spore coat protein U-like protein
MATDRRLQLHGRLEINASGVLTMTTFRTRLISAVSVIGLIAAFSVNTAQAQTATGTLNVTATVLDTCEISATADVAFGNLMPVPGSGDANATGSITWACTVGSGIDIGIADGDRFLIGTATPIPYTLWQDAARSVHWGAQGSGDELPVPAGGGIGLASPFVSTVYGQILEADYVTADPGAYTDDLVVTIEF